MKRIMALTVVALFALATTAVAQQGPPRGERGRGQQRGGRGQGPRMGQFFDRIIEELNLDEEQMAQVDEIRAAQQERMQDMRAQWEEMRAAMESGDEQRVAELREQMQAQRGNPGAAMQTMLDQIEPILHDDQLEAFDRIRERMNQRTQQSERWRDQMRMIQELPDAVGMTDEQREQYQNLLTQRREDMMQRMRDRRGGPGGGQPGEQGGGQPGERGGQPGEPGDQPGGQPGDRPRGRPDFQGMSDEFFEQVAAILNEDQLEALAEYRAKMAAGATDRETTEGDNVRTVIQATRRISDLSSDQKQAIRELERDTMRASRELSSRDKEGQALLAAKLKADVVKLLDKKQTDEFTQNLERLKSRSGRSGERGNRADRSRRNRRDRAADESSDSNNEDDQP